MNQEMNGRSGDLEGKKERRGEEAGDQGCVRGGAESTVSWIVMLLGFGWLCL